MLHFLGAGDQAQVRPKLVLVFTVINNLLAFFEKPEKFFKLCRRCILVVLV
jgi:hypothetical protein